MALLLPNSQMGIMRKNPTTVLNLTGAVAGFWDANSETWTLNNQANFQSVSQFNDLSGNARHLNQATTASQPRLVRGIGNIQNYTVTLNNDYWIKSSAVATDGAGIAPDGSNTATLLTNTGATAYIQNQTPLTVVPNTTYTASCYLKKTNNRWSNMQFWDGQVGYRYWFDLDNGVNGASVVAIGSPSTRSWSNGSQTITRVGNGWYRCTITAFIGASTSLAIAGAGHFAVNGDGLFTLQSGIGQSVLTYGQMLNIGATANEYIGRNLLSFNGANSMATSSIFSMATLTAVFSRSVTTQSVLRSSSNAFFRGFAGDAFPGFTFYPQYAANNFALAASNPQTILPIPVGGRETLSLLYGGGGFQPSLSLNTKFILGDDLPDYTPLDGYVAALLGTNRALTTIEAQKLQVYLARRYGSWRSLAPGNPFRYHDVQLVY
jgi:hypothetical protein